MLLIVRKCSRTPRAVGDILFLFVGLACALVCSGCGSPTFEVPYVAKGPIVIDGVLGSAEWPEDGCVTLPNPVRKPRAMPPFPTACLQYDGEHLYVGLNCPRVGAPTPAVDAPGNDHEAIALANDNLEIYLEPEGTGEGYFFQICVNAANMVYDRWWPSERVVREIRTGKTPREFILAELAYEDGVEWRVTGMTSAVQVLDLGWSVEVRIPWSSLFEDGAPEAEEWGVNLAVHSVGYADDWYSWAETSGCLIKATTFRHCAFR